MEARPNTEAKRPWKTGRFRKGIRGIVIRMTPVMIPAAPRPAMARPTIRASEFGATPHMREPISKTRMARRKVLVKVV